VSNPGYSSNERKDAHGLTHEGHRDSLKTFIEFHTWQNSVYADLINNFKNNQVGDGALLDYSNLLYFVESGYRRGFDSTSRWSPHSLENIVAMNAGGKKLGVKLGQHINGKERHPMMVTTITMVAMKIANPQVGDITGVMSEIL